MSSRAVGYSHGEKSSHPKPGGRPGRKGTATMHQHTTVAPASSSVRINSSKILPGRPSSTHRKSYQRLTHSTTPGAPVTPTSQREYAHAIRQRYAHASRAVKSQMLTEFCATTGYHRTYRPNPAHQPRAPRQAALGALWEVAGYPWSARLTALLPVWLPWAKRHLSISPQVEQQLRTISPSTIDRRLRGRTRRLNRRLYGRTKPGTLLKHHIPLKTDHWDVTAPGFTEMDLVSHSGNSADGEFLQTLNLTDIHTGWSETYAIMWTRTTAPNSSMTTSSGTAWAARSNSPAGAPTRKTTMRPSSRRTGRTSGSSWAGTGTIRPRRLPRSTTSTATSSAS